MVLAFAGMLAVAIVAPSGAVASPRTGELWVGRYDAAANTDDANAVGLHTHDVAKLLTVLNRLVDKNNSMIVIEHNLDVLKTADYIIDLGPEDGDAGGTIVAQGTPYDVASTPISHTGTYLKTLLIK